MTINENSVKRKLAITLFFINC